MAEIIWGEEAILDMEEVYEYIARDSPLYARQQVEHIYNTVERLIHFPESGRHIPEFPELPHREVIVGNYRIFYRYDPERDAVYIVSVAHGARLPRKLSEKK